MLFVLLYFCFSFVYKTSPRSAIFLHWLSNLAFFQFRLRGKWRPRSENLLDFSYFEPYLLLLEHYSKVVKAIETQFHMNRAWFWELRKNLLGSACIWLKKILEFTSTPSLPSYWRGSYRSCLLLLYGKCPWLGC